MPPSTSKKVIATIYLGYGPEGLAILELIKQAASLESRSLSDFITRAALSHAQSLLHEKRPYP